MSYRQRFLWRLLFIAVLIVLVYILLPRGVTVTVINVGKTPLHRAVIHVTGHSYEVGNIDPGKSAARRVEPQGESGVEVTFNTKEGKEKRLVAGGYFEPHLYFGRVVVEINGELDKPVAVRDNIYIVPW